MPVQVAQCSTFSYEWPVDESRGAETSAVASLVLASVLAASLGLQVVIGRCQAVVDRAPASSRAVCGMTSSDKAGLGILWRLVASLTLMLPVPLSMIARMSAVPWGGDGCLS